MNEFRVGDLDPRGSEEILKSFFADAAVGLSITDLEGRFVKVNLAYCALTGYTEAELKARDFQSITHPDDLPRTLARVQALLSGESSSFLIEKRYIRKDSIIVWVLNSVSVIRDKHGQPLNLVRSSQDISEQLQLRESLRQAEVRTQSILANITDIYLLFDYQWRYVYVNEAAVRAIGRPLELVLGRTLWEVFPDIVGTDLEREYRRAMDDRVTVNCDFYYPARDNWWENRFYPVPAGLAVFATDITERKRAEESLKLFRSLLDRSNDAIEVLDPDTLRFLDCNESACRSLGYSREEFLAMSVADIDPNLDELKTAAVTEELKRSGFAMFESTRRRKDGSTFPVEVNVKEIQLERAYRLAVVRDITERKLTEKLLGQSEQQLAEAQNVAHLGSWNWDIQSNTVTWSDELYRICGFQPRSFSPTYEAFLALVHPEDRESVERAQANCLGRHEAFSFQQRIIRPDEEVRVLQSYGNVVCDHAGNPTRMFGTCQDVTEQKRAEEALREAERKYREIFENAGEGIFQTTPEGQYIEANPTLARMHGFDSPEEFLRSRQDITREVYVDPARREEFKRLIAEHGVVRGFEHRIYRKDGSRIWISVNARAVRDRQGSVAYYEGTTQDITERKRSEEELRESEERFSKAFYSSPAPLIITRLVDGCFLNANDSFLSTFEYDRAEVIGKTVRDLNIYVDRQDRKKLIEELREQGSLREYESQARTKSGRILDLLVSVEPIKLKGEQCILSTAYDITGRKSIEEALRESEERYRELFENAKDALYVHDLGGRYMSFNRAAEQLSGFTRDEILGKHFSNFVAPGSLKDVRENLCKKLDQEGETTYEIDLVTKDRRRVPVEVCSRLIYENGKPIGIQGVARDITDRKRAREALRTYSQRLIEAQEAERQVIARELHDEIGQVLTVVRINLESLKRSAETGSAPQALDESLMIVDEALERVRELSLNLRPSVLDNLGLSSALRWYVDRYARRSGIIADLKSDLEDGTRLRLELETACFRIVQEALTNVVRHARATHVLVRINRSNGNLHLKVKDNGVGFDVQTLLKDWPPALALGLRGMEERAAAVQGRLKIDSAPMRGTEISVSFPLKEGL